MSTPSVTILKNLVLNWESNQMEEETIATFAVNAASSPFVPRSASAQKSI